MRGEERGRGGGGQGEVERERRGRDIDRERGIEREGGELEGESRREWEEQRDRKTGEIVGE